MKMTLRTRLALAGAVLLAAAAGGAWALWFRSDVRAGPGPFTAEYEQCQSRLSDEVQRIAHQVIEATTWRQGDAAQLHIGGKFRIQGAVHDYDCLIRQGRVLQVDVW